MGTRTRLLCGAILSVWLASSALGQQALQWQPTLETAKRVAGQTDRLLLVHFWAPWCKPCAEMETQVLHRPDVIEAVQREFVPVRLNVDHFPAKAREYGITVIPTDVVITPEGDLVGRVIGSVGPLEYVNRLRGLADAWAGRTAGTYTQSPLPSQNGLTPENVTPGGPHDPPAAGQPSPPRYSDDRYADYFHRYAQPTVTPSAPAYARPAPPVGDQGRAVDKAGRERYTAPGPESRGQASPPQVSDQPGQRSPAVPSPQPPDGQKAWLGPPSRTQSTGAPPYWDPRFDRPPHAALAGSQQPTPQASPGALPPAVELPPGSPPLGLDGYCPVRLSEEERWVFGDRRWGVRHEGRTYLFAGPEEQRRFLADPDRFAPVLSGNDVVAAVEQGQVVAGRREHGAWFCGRVYLFASEASLARFSTSPDRYSSTVATPEASSEVARRPFYSPWANPAVPPGRPNDRARH